MNFKLHWKMNYCHHPWERYWMPYINLTPAGRPVSETHLPKSACSSSNQCTFFLNCRNGANLWGSPPHFLFVFWLILLPYCKKDCIILGSGSINSFPPWHQGTSWSREKIVTPVLLEISCRWWKPSTQTCFSVLSWPKLSPRLHSCKTFLMSSIKG